MKTLDRPSTPSPSTSNPDTAQETESIRVPRITVMWALIALVLAVVGAYLASGHPTVQNGSYVPAPVVVPMPADSEMIASAR